MLIILDDTQYARAVNTTEVVVCIVAQVLYKHLQSYQTREQYCVNPLIDTRLATWHEETTENISWTE